MLRKYFSCLVYLGSVILLQAQEPDKADPLVQARELAGAGEYAQAREILSGKLQEHPDDRDFQTLFAKTYSWEGNYPEARRVLNGITSSHRQETEAWRASVRNEIYSRNWSLALGMVNKALIYLPEDPVLNQLRSEILLSHQAEIASGSQDSQPHRKERAEKPLTNHGLFLRSSAEGFSSTFKPMYSQAVGLELVGNAGKLIPALQVDRRFEIDGLQWQLDIYPRITKQLYAYAGYAYSTAPIFPDHRVGGELYYNTKNQWEFSGGARYFKFRDGDALVYTGSAGKYDKNTYWSARSFVTMDDSGVPAISGLLLGRKYFKDALHYLGLSVGYGYNTELRQLRDGDELLSATLLFVQSQQLGIEYQWHPGQISAWKLSLRGMRQEFSFDPGNYFLSLNLGLEYRLLFR